MKRIFFIIVLFLLFSCYKQDWVKNASDGTERFFALQSRTNFMGKRAAALLQQAERLHPFAATLVSRAGFPRWDKVLVQYDAMVKGSDTILLVPLVPNGSPRVHAVIELRMSDQVVMRVFGAADYKNYPHGLLAGSSATAERFAVEFMKIEKQVFGYDQFVLRDDSLLKASVPAAQQRNRFLKLNIVPLANAMASLGSNGDCYEAPVYEYLPDGTEWFTGETQLVGNCSGSGYPGGFGIFSGGNPVVISGWTTNAPPVGSGPGWINWPVYHPPQGWVPGYVADADCPPLIGELQQDTAFISKLRELNSRSVTNLSYEKGYEVRRRDWGLYEPVTGTPNQALINWTILFATDGLMHSHYRGLNSIFSPGDMVFMAQLWLRGLARDSSRFFFVVTSGDAFPYLVVVNDVAKYRRFAERITRDAAAIEEFKREYSYKFNFQDIDKNAKGFLEMLRKEAKGGLTLFRASETCDKWHKMELDAWGAVNTIDCY